MQLINTPSTPRSHQNLFGLPKLHIKCPPGPNKSSKLHLQWMPARVTANQRRATDLSEAGLSCSARGGRHLGLQAPDPDMPPCVSHYDMLLLAVAAHAVHAVQPVHSCSDDAQQCRAGSHLPHTHTAIACASCEICVWISWGCKPPSSMQQASIVCMLHSTGSIVGPSSLSLCLPGSSAYLPLQLFAPWSSSPSGFHL